MKRLLRLPLMLTLRGHLYSYPWKEGYKVPKAVYILGTTNEMDFLKDKTGNRRFWTVMVGKNIDIWTRRVTLMRKDFYYGELC